MSTASSLPYRLRPNKAVDRELFLALLGRLAAHLNIENYTYIGMGGPYLEDFRLIHAKLGIDKLVCVEVEEQVHLRQLFNRPIEAIECVNDSFEDYLDSTEFDGPVVIWFDYTDPKAITDQIERFSRSIGEVPVGSILRVTLNAAPSSLGNQSDAEKVTGKDLQEWRMDRFKERMGTMFPSETKPEGMTFQNFGNTILKALFVAVERVGVNFKDRKVVWALATHYADGQPMVTASLIIVDREDVTTGELVGKWKYFSTPSNPLKIDMPALSTKERILMESSQSPEDVLRYELPTSDLGQNPFEAFRRFYRVFPHFARVDL